MPLDLAVGSGVAVVGDARGRVRVFARGDDPDTRTPADDLANVVTLLAALRSHVIDDRWTHHCNGLNCTRAHGDLTADRALALGCLHFFDDLGARIGSDALATAFLTLGLTPPAIPADRDARIQLASRGEGWTISPREALALARGLQSRPPPWSDVLERGLVPSDDVRDNLRGKAAGRGEMRGWFVGFEDGAAHRVVVVRVTRCLDACSHRATAIARWAIAQPTPR